jgi:WD40 repeat protein
MRGVVNGPDDHSGAGDEQSARMRAGVRAGVLRRTRSGLMRLTPSRLIGVLCASAFSPIIVSATGVAPAVVASVGVLGSVGAGVLTEMVVKVLDSGRGRRGRSDEEIEGELAETIERALDADDANSPALRAETAAVLRSIGAVETAFEVVVEAGDREQQGELLQSLGSLSTVDGFGFVLTVVAQAAGEIQETLRRQDVERRADRERDRERALQLQMMREDLAVVARRTRSPADEPVGEWAGCPYRGLWPFEADHARIFYGREQATAELVTNLAERMVGLGMLVVTGASGAGKSSLLRAGLIPAVARGQLTQGSETWPRLVMTPTAKPLEEFATHLAVAGGMDAATVRSALAEAPEQAHLVIRQAVINRCGASPRNPPPRLVLVVDQVEEIFTLSGADSEAERSAFLTILHRIASTPVGADGDPPALVVLGLRGDFWDRCASYPQLVAALQTGPYVVGPMTEAELRRAIIGPAAAAGLEVEPGLTDTILDDLRSSSASRSFEGGTLPLLSQATLETWEHREGDRLTSRAYGRAGGIAHAVQTSAEEVFAGFTADQQDIARTVLLRLTIVSRDGQFARRRVARTDLHREEAGWRGSDVDVVLNAFAVKRLLILNNDSAEIAHHVFLHAWPRLRGWLDSDHTDRALYSQLIDDAAIWHSNDRAGSFLYREARLSAVRQATMRWGDEPTRYPPLPGSVSTFVAASSRAANRAVRIRRVVAAGLAILTVAAGAGAFAAGKYASAANRQHTIALSRQLTTQSQIISPSDPVTARRLAVAAWRIAPVPEARDNMTDLLSEQRGTLVGHVAPVRAVAFSPQGRMLVSASEDGTVRRWDPITGNPVGQPLAGHVGPVYGAAFSPDGGVIVSVGEDRTVRRWDASTGAPIGAPLTGHTGTISAIAVSPDGRTIATASDDYTVRFWGAATGQPIGVPLAGHTGPVYGLAFSPDSRMLVSVGADRTVRRWQVATGQPIGAPSSGHLGTVYAVAFSPNGRMLATASADGTVRRWNPATGQPIGAALTGHTGAVNGLAYSPDGRTLATASADDTVRRWDTATGQPVGTPLTARAGTVYAVAFSPDGRTLATANADDTVRRWDVATGQPIGAPLSGHTGTVYATVFSPDGRMLASVSADHTVRRWDVATGQPIGAPLSGHTGPVSALAFSPDGRMLATGSDDYTVRRWDAVTGAAIGRPLRGHGDTVYAVAFSPDGRMLATGSADHTVRRWDVATGQPIGAPLTGAGGTVYGVAFSPDGRMLASASADGTVRLWDPHTGRPVGSPLVGHSGWVLSVTFRADGGLLASTGTDGTVRLWDPHTGRPVGNPINGHDGTINAAAFSRDGSILATAAADHTVRLWNPHTGAAIGSPLTGHTGPVSDVVFSPDGSTLATASYDRTIRLWDASLYIDPFASICGRVGSPTRDEWNRYAPGEALPRVCP